MGRISVFGSLSKPPVRVEIALWFCQEIREGVDNLRLSGPRPLTSQGEQIRILSRKTGCERLREAQSRDERPERLPTRDTSLIFKCYSVLKP